MGEPPGCVRLVASFEKGDRSTAERELILRSNSHSASIWTLRYEHPRLQCTCRKGITLGSIPFPRCTTSAQPECCRDDRPSKLLPYHGDGCGRAPRRRIR